MVKNDFQSQFRVKHIYINIGDKQKNYNSLGKRKTISGLRTRGD